MSVGANYGLLRRREGERRFPGLLRRREEEGRSFSWSSPSPGELDNDFRIRRVGIFLFAYDHWKVLVFHWMK